MRHYISSLLFIRAREEMYKVENDNGEAPAVVSFRNEVYVCLVSKSTQFHNLASFSTMIRRQIRKFFIIIDIERLQLRNLHKILI